MQSTAWSEMYAKRSEWALRAYDEFVNTVHPWLRDDLVRREHVTLVVYGPTQVGKTTLILTTLGIHPDRLGVVGDVLRGGQAAGKSATVLAARYGRSLDNRWRLGGGGPLDAAAMVEALAGIRARMESGADVGSEIVDIKLPLDQFADAEHGPSVSIIDLPGTDAALGSEARHVHRLMEKYVPAADVVLMVTRAEGLGALHPGALPLECMRDWTMQPAKFRVVLTYTFSTATIRERWFPVAKADGSAHAEGLRTYLYGQLASHDMPLPVTGSACLYPMEFGDSLRDLQRELPDYSDDAVTISSALIKELLDSLAQASNPYRRLTSAFNVSALVKRKQERLDMDYKTSSAELRMQIEEADKRWSTATKAHVLVMADRDSKEALLATLKGSSLVEAFEKDVKKAFSIQVGSVGKETVAAVRRQADEHVDCLLAAWHALRFDQSDGLVDEITDNDATSWLAAVMDARPSSAPSVELAYRDLISTLRSHILGDYYTWMPGSSFAEDCAALRASGRHAQEIAENETMRWVKDGLGSARIAAERDIRKTKKRVDSLEADLVASRVLLDELTERLATIDAEYGVACESMSDSVVRSRIFRERMTAGYHAREQELRAEIVVEPSPERRFLLLALRELHQNEFADALEGFAA